MATVRKPSASSGDIYKSVITNVATVRNFEAISEKFEEDRSLYFGGDGGTGITSCNIYRVASNKDDD
jgi:hypothetical protein